MKRLAAIALVLALSALPVCAQRGGGSHGGSSGGHGGFSGSHGGGFSGFHGGSSGFHSGSGGFSHGGFHGSAPGRFAGPPPVRFGGFPPARGGPMSPRFAGPTHYVSNPMPYGGAYRPPRLNPVGPRSIQPRAPYPGSLHRMPYDGRHDGKGWNHGGDHRWDRGRHRHHHDDDDDFGFIGFNSWVGYPYWPWWGWGYPDLFDNWDSWDNYDSQPSSDYGAAQYPEYAPGTYDQYSPQQDQPSPEQPESQQPPSYAPWPYSRPAPSSSSQVIPSAPPAPDVPVTLVFKDGRPNEKIHNYLLTNSTLSVLDQQRQVIPVDQLDIAATERVNREAGVDFALPGPGR